MATGLFQFQHAHNRSDDWLDESINWKDDEAAIEFSMNQKREEQGKAGELQFKVGIAIIPRAEIDRINKLPSVNGILSYERQRKPDNRYHGNILLRKDVPALTKKRMCGTLATLVKAKIIREGME